MERLVRLATALHHAGRVGMDAERLIKVAGFEGGADATSALTREFRHLRNLGWQIDNVAGVGEAARYVMTTVDNRLKVRLTPAQQAALFRAVLLADRDDLVERLGLSEAQRPPEVIGGISTSSVATESLAAVVNAVKRHAVLRFRYKGSDRVVHPSAVRTRNGTWYLSAFEDGADEAKSFVVSRMSDVVADQPGTAGQLGAVKHAGLHPMTWEVDPPIDVTLRAPEEHAPDVRRWLDAPAAETETDGMVEMVYRVTNRAALRSRLYELGPRVTVVGPDEIRAEIIDELAFMAGE
jgi:proteasome accessory factor B